MADTPPLKEGDEEPPGTMYALVGPATDDGEVGVISGCDQPSGLTTSCEVRGVLLIKIKMGFCCACRIATGWGILSHLSLLKEVSCVCGYK